MRCDFDKLRERGSITNRGSSVGKVSEARSPKKMFELSQEAAHLGCHSEDGNMNTGHSAEKVVRITQSGNLQIKHLRYPDF
jgi:hypothetical protein